MNNNELFNKFKKQVAIYNFEQEYKENKSSLHLPEKRIQKYCKKMLSKCED